MKSGHDIFKYCTAQHILRNMEMIHYHHSYHNPPWSQQDFDNDTSTYHIIIRVHIHDLLTLLHIAERYSKIFEVYHLQIRSWILSETIYSFSKNMYSLKLKTNV